MIDGRQPPAISALVLRVRRGCRFVVNRVDQFAVALLFHPQWNSEADIGAVRYARGCPQSPAVGFDD